MVEKTGWTIEYILKLKINVATLFLNYFAEREVERFKLKASLMGIKV
ncbi:MAG: hypothetical protein ACOYWZ_08825 [Bacillota bacterium]